MGTPEPEAHVAVSVTVTFLRMETPPAHRVAPLPPDVSLVRAEHCTAAFYRFLYDTVGARHCWWLRRTLTVAELERMLADPSLTIDVLYRAGQPVGFFELERRRDQSVNLAYFGLLPHAIGQGLGTAFLRASVDAAWAAGARMLTVNTSSADHPRALPGYLRAGFRPVRHVQERWMIPRRLGLDIPANLIAPAA